MYIDFASVAHLSLLFCFVFQRRGGGKLQRKLCLVSGKDALSLFTKNEILSVMGPYFIL